MAFHPNSQMRLIEQDFDPDRMIRQGVKGGIPWSNIQEFATSDEYCGLMLYPRQVTLLKLIFLETDNMTSYDLQVIDEWRTGFTRHRDIYGVQPDIWERVEYLKSRGYRRFPHIQCVLGRRASKGFMGAIIAAEQIAYLISLDNPQAYYGIREGKDVFLNVGATSQTQAQRHQFADIRDVVENCAFLQPYVAESKDHQMRLRTPADLRRIGMMQAQGVPIEHAIATLWVVALSASSVAGRGATSYANYFDEMAFHVQGTDSTKSSENIYEDWQPSLGQFKKDALTYVPSSPFCLSGDTPVLTEDLRWVRVDSLRLGDRLIGFDEFPPGKNTGGNNRRTWQPAVVTETSVIRAPRYKMVMQSGKTIVCTGEHLWLCAPPRRTGWRKTKDIKPGDRIRALNSPPWSEDDSWEGGYLAGFFDAEGHLGGKYGHTQGLSSLGYGQNAGAVQVLVERLLKERGFQTRTKQGSGRSQDAQHVWSLINGGAAEMMRFLGTVRPERLLKSFPSKFYGGAIHGAARAVDIVQSVEYLDDGEVIALGTSTNTLVADGLLSHNTKTGKFYELYQHGRVLMSHYRGEGSAVMSEQELAALRAKAEEDEVELAAEPGMLIFQGPSWALYEDWQRGPELVQINFTAAPEDDLSAEEQQRRKLRNPEKFKVEREGQFAEVLGAYLDGDKVDAMFNPVPWRDPAVLTPTPFGRFDTSYRIHVDPSKTGANFALAVAHVEMAPPDTFGERWPHVIIDRLHVWRAQDFPVNPDTGKHEIDYTQVERELDQILYTFPSCTKFSADQWNSVGFLQRLRKKYSPKIRISEETATEKSNYERAEKFKSALNLGWVHSFRDNLFNDGTESSLLEMECKFLSEKNGKVFKQDFGPVTTKDLYDAVSVVVTDLLHDALERWGGERLTASAYGSTDGAALRSGREFEKADTLRANRYAAGHHGQGRAWEQLAQSMGERRAGRGYSPDRTRSIGTRARRY